MALQVTGLQVYPILLTFIYHDDFDDRVQWDINRVGAHAVRAAVWWAVVTVAELLWWDVLDLGQHRRRW